MLLNKFLFPAPKPPTYSTTSHQEHLFWLPANAAGESPIPCMFYSPARSNRKPEYFIIFCHGNGCDIGSMHDTLNEFSNQLNMYVMSFEYPTYGLCTASSPSQQTINDHAERAFHFAHSTLNCPVERIIIYGHSIGSGAACYLASKHRIAALILQSPYTAISSLVREKVRVLSYLVSTRSWDNLEAMQYIACPVLFIHGLDDTLIPPSHSQSLFDACQNHDGKKIVLLRNEDHNSMTETILLRYITPFLVKQCRPAEADVVLPAVKINEQLRDPPPAVLPNDATNSTGSAILSSLQSMSKASTAATMSTVRAISGKNKNPSDDDK